MMSMSATISLRVPKKLKDLLGELNIDWHDKVRRCLEELVAEELRNRMLSEADEIRNSIGRETSSAAKLIREDREHVH